MFVFNCLISNVLYRTHIHPGDGKIVKNISVWPKYKVCGQNSVVRNHIVEVYFQTL